MKPWLSRTLGASIVSVAVLAACETRHVVGLGGTSTPPSLTITIAGSKAPAGATVVTMPVSGTLGYTVTAGHPVSLLSVTDSARYKGSLLISHDTTFHAQTTTFTDGATLALGNPVAGDTVRLVAKAADGSGNVVRDTMLVVFGNIGPRVTLFNPPSMSTLGINDSLVVSMAFRDTVSGLTHVSLKGYSVRGNPAIQATTTVQLYDSVTYDWVPPKMPIDTLRRLLRRNGNPTTAADSIAIFEATVSDAAGYTTTSQLRLRLVSGPSLTVTADSTAFIGKVVTVSLRGIDKNLVSQLGYTATSSGYTGGSPAGTIASRTFYFSPGKDTAFVTDTFKVPTGVGPTIVITPNGQNALGQIGAGPTFTTTVAAVPPVDTTPPLVYQAVPSRFEQGASILVKATDPSRVVQLGYIMFDSTGTTVLRRDSTIRKAGSVAPPTDSAYFPIAFADSLRGRHIVFTSFAYDSMLNRGVSIPAGTTTPQRLQTSAKRDTVRAVYGKTFTLPTGSLPADLVVDSTRQRVYVSNIAQSLLNYWDNATQAFSASVVNTGAAPWGMFIDNANTKMYVANSGGTNIDVVDLVAQTAVNRLQPPPIVIYDLTRTVDATTGLVRISLAGPIQFSDRPQFVAQSQNGNIYFSTRPTPSATQGTLRRLDPTLAYPEARLIYQYGDYAGATKYTIANADGASVVLGQTGMSDQLTVCSHIFGTAPSPTNRYCFTSSSVDSIVTFFRTIGSAVDIPQVLTSSLGLTDTTFVAAGGDRRRMAFGEGNTSAPGRVVLVTDTIGMSALGPPSGTNPSTYSSGVQVRSFIANASSQVYGVTMNKVSSIVGVHGVRTFYGNTNLQLLGSVGSLGGAGLAFHPDNDGTQMLTNLPARIAFAAETDTTVAIYDTYRYTQRGRLPTSVPITGALRAVKPFPGDAIDVVAKLFCLTKTGMIVINVRQSDIGPTQP